MPSNQISGSFTATGDGPSASFYQDYNITISGTFVGTVALQRSFDGGLTWNNVARDTYGTIATFNAPISLIAFEPENGVSYRLSCTAYTSGTLNWRLSQ
jgi:hypothetical protein